MAAAGARRPGLLSRRSIGARPDAGTDPVGDGPTGRSPLLGARPIGPWAFAGVAIASFGGLAIAALTAPQLVGDAADSAGLAMLAGAVVFAIPLAIWFCYSRHTNGPGGLYAFVEAAAGRRLALAQAAIWSFSYLLYLIYTTVQIVYDVLPSVIPSERNYQSLLALGIPVVLAGVMVAGRAAALIVICAIAVGQVALAGILDGVTLAHVATPASSFTAGAPTGSLVKASAQTSLLYICGSLPLFLGGELERPARTIREGIAGAYLLTAVIVVVAVAPLAAAPGLLHTDVPGVSVAQEFAGPGLARAIGIGVAASIAGLMLCEYLALSRLIYALHPRRMRPITMVIGAIMILAAPISLIDPAGFYNALIKPSLIALWLSQLIVFVVYPSFARKHHQRMAPAWTLAAGASALAFYGLWTALQQASS